MKNIDKEQAEGVIERLLIALKIPSNWAKIIAGAIVGAMIAWAALNQTSCSPMQVDPPGHTGVSIDNGQYTITRDGRTLTWDKDTQTLWWKQNQPDLPADVPPVVVTKGK